MFMPIILSGPLFLIATGRQAEAQRVIFGVMISFVVCYAFFTLFPVSGPNWVFEHRTGPVREVLPARWVYSMLATGAVPGTAFPSSHVATTMAATAGAWLVSPRLGEVLLIPCILLVAGTVYTQMHYAIDTSAGLVVGIFGVLASVRFGD